MKKTLLSIIVLTTTSLYGASYMPTMKINNLTGKKMYYALSHDKSIPSMHNMTKSLTLLEPGQEVDFFTEYIDPSKEFYAILHPKKKVSKKDTFAFYKFLPKKNGRNGKIEQPHFIYINLQLDENKGIKVMPQSNPYATEQDKTHTMNNVIADDRIKVNHIRYASLPKQSKL